MLLHNEKFRRYHKQPLYFNKNSPVIIPKNHLERLKRKWPKGLFKLFKRGTLSFSLGENQNMKLYEFEVVSKHLGQTSDKNTSAYLFAGK